MACQGKEKVGEVSCQVSLDVVEVFKRKFIEDVRAVCEFYRRSVDEKELERWAEAMARHLISPLVEVLEAVAHAWANLGPFVRFEMLHDLFHLSTQIGEFAKKYRKEQYSCRGCRDFLARKSLTSGEGHQQELGV